MLPAKEFDGMWERCVCNFFPGNHKKSVGHNYCMSKCSLIYEPGLKQRLLRYAQSALLFTEKGVDPFLVSWNRSVAFAFFFSVFIAWVYNASDGNVTLDNHHLVSIHLGSMDSYVNVQSFNVLHGNKNTTSTVYNLWSIILQ